MRSFGERSFHGLEHRLLGRTGKWLSLLSLGCMRLPEDDEEGAKVVSRAVDLGINYLETSEWYCNGRSEIMVGMGTKGRRDRVYISTKVKVTPDKKGDDVKRAFEGSLKRLGVDYVDFYQVWDFRMPEFDAVFGKGGALDVIESLRDQGLVSHIGMTTHESNENVIKCIDSGRIESITLTYNMLEREKEPVIQYAYEHGVGVVIMKPLAGGMLATPSDVLSNLPAGKKGSTAAIGLSFVMSNPYVTTVPSGMTSVAEVEENVQTAEDFVPLTEDEREQLVHALDHFKALGDQFCTGCNYCKDCPNGVKIARLFNIRNYYVVFGMKDWAIRSYERLKSKHPINCTECGECEKKCPNGIPIIQQIKEVVELFEGGDV